MRIKILFLKQIILTVFILTNSITIYAQELTQTNKAKWELGVGLGVLSLPHYRGSDQRAEYAIPVPYFRYNGKRLKVDREGGHFYFYYSEGLKVDVSTAFVLPVDSDNNRARQGMKDLGLLLELGPRIQFSLYRSTDKNLRVYFAIPLREAFDLYHKKDVGWTFSPYLQLRYYNTGWETAVSIGPVWASEKYNDSFYEVAPQYATVMRPAYNAQAGYSGSRLTLTLSKRFDDIFFGLFARYDNLSEATFIDSPLIKQNDSFIIGAALSWVFKKPE